MRDSSEKTTIVNHALFKTNSDEKIFHDVIEVYVCFYPKLKKHEKRVPYCYTQLTRIQLCPLYSTLINN